MLWIAWAVVVGLLSACGAPGVGINEPTSSASSSTNSSSNQGIRCVLTRSGVADGVDWALAVVGQRSGPCPQQSADEIAACFQRVEDPFEKALQCVRDSTLVGDVGGVGEMGVPGRSGLLALTSKSPNIGVDCVSSIGTNPELANDKQGAKKGGKALGDGQQALLAYGPVLVAAKEMAEARQEWQLSAGTPQEKEAKAKYDKAVEVYNTAVEVAQEIEALPGPSKQSLAKALAAWFAELWETLFGDEEAPEEEPQGRPDPLAEEDCEGLESFLRECNAGGWQTLACENFLSSLRNPGCDPTVAYTAEGTPCAKPELSPREMAEALNKAIIRCWSLINPGPDGSGLCSVRPVDVPLSSLVAAPRGVCGKPDVMPTDEQCVAEFLEPREVAEKLLGTPFNPWDLLTGTSAPPIPPRPEENCTVQC